MVAEELGVVVEASYEGGFGIVVGSNVDIEDIPIGSYILVSSGRYDYLCLVADVGYKMPIDESLFRYLSGEYSDMVRRYLSRRIVNYFVRAIPVGRAGPEGVDKSDTIPSYGSKALIPSQELLSRFYGRFDWRVNYPLGEPKVIGKVEYSIPINIRRMIDLNFGIFGKSGSGKTFLGNLIVAYTMLYNKLARDSDDYIEARFLIFDMHNEYSLDVLDDARRRVAGGVFKLFPDDFVVYTPDSRFASEFKMNLLPIPLYDISSSLLVYVLEPLGVTRAFLDNLSGFENKLRKFFREKSPFGDAGYWVLGLILSKNNIRKFVELGMEGGSHFIEKNYISQRELGNLVDAIEQDIADMGQGALQTFKANRRRLSRLLDMPVSFKKIYKGVMDTVAENLVSRDGRSVIISMGGYEKNLPVYMAIANLIGEALWSRLNQPDMEEVEETNKIIIMLEEAHKFLGRGVSEYSPFGRIAREMRKKGVVVAPIDQKPYELDPDVLSMIWTYIVFALTDDRDIDASLTGIDRPSLYRNIVASLRRGEALVYGYGVSFPVVLKVHDYSRMYRELVDMARGDGEPSIFDDVPG